MWVCVYICVPHYSQHNLFKMTKMLRKQLQVAVRCMTLIVCILIKCSQCSAVFAGLKQHNLVHTGKIPHKCIQCFAVLSHHISLKQHQRVLTCEKPFNCSQCSAAFSDSSTLYQHLRTHTREKPFKWRSMSCFFLTSLWLFQHLKNAINAALSHTSTLY